MKDKVDRVGKAKSDGRLNRGGIAWSLFEGARAPAFNLITIYVFMPYVAVTMVGDAVRGQEVLSRWAQWGGWAVMATAPFIGASVDKIGGRKRGLALLVGLMVPLCAALWWAKPDGSGLSVSMTMLVASALGILSAYNEILHNSLLVRAAGLSGVHRASGLALSFSGLLTVAALLFTAWAFALPGKVDWGFVPAAPLFGLDPLKHEPERVVTLLSAGLLLLFSLPLFLWTPDAPGTGTPLIQAFAEGAAELWRMLKTVSHFKDAAFYLAARMLFVDGMNGVLTYFGVLAVGVMKWSPLELLAYGIFSSTLTVLGGYVAQWLDAGVGPKNALRIQILMSGLALTGMLGMGPDRILYFWRYDPATSQPLWGGPVFNHAPDVIFALQGLVAGVFIAAQYGSSRTIMTRITPAERTGAFFGVYALSGVATAWLAPTLVNLGTRLTGTQQGGFAMLVLLLALGLAVLSRVRGGGRVARDAGRP